MITRLPWHHRFPKPICRQTLDQYEEWLSYTGQLTSVVAEAISRARGIYNTHQPLSYIAGPLTNVSEERKERYVKAGELSCTYGFWGYVPHLYGTDPIKHPGVTKPEVRNIDYLWAIIMADFHINFLFPTAHGNGIEYGWGEENHIPTVACVPYGIDLSRLPGGMINLYALIQYDEKEEPYQKLTTFLGIVRTWLNAHPGTNIINFIDTYPLGMYL